MSATERYARQLAVPGIGAAGQARIAAGLVELAGSGIDAEICALYLAGAGVGRLRVPALWLEPCRALNASIDVGATDLAGSALVVRVGGGAPYAPTDEDPVARGARAARYALATLLGGGGGTT